MGIKDVLRKISQGGNEPVDYDTYGYGDDESIDDTEEYMDAVRAIFANAKAGKDGMSAELVFSEE